MAIELNARSSSRSLFSMLIIDEEREYSRTSGLRYSNNRMRQSVYAITSKQVNLGNNETSPSYIFVAQTT